MSRNYAQTWKDWSGGCPVCGLTYAANVEEDRRYHRTTHRKVLETHEPKPVGLADGFLRIDSDSRLALRNRLENIGRMFRHELAFDFLPYCADPEADLPGHHWLIVKDRRPIGGLSVRWRKYSDAPPRWVWAWVWVIPSERRSGWMERCWEMVRAEFPGIDPEFPLSFAAAKFFAGRDDVPQDIRRRAQRQVERA